MAKQVKKDAYVAYVSSYTSGGRDNYGIRIYDVDLENGRFISKEKVMITNSSYISVSHNKKTLYSITDAGVESYHIEKDGGLTFINKASINGMRGCYLNSDQTDSFLFCAGYHDGKITALKLNEDGSIGEIIQEIYQKGLGMMAGRNHVPHVQCIKASKDNKYICAVDLGMDRINVYSLDPVNGRLKDADIIHCDQESSPRHIQFSRDGRFLYVVYEQKCAIDVFAYEDRNGEPWFERLQTVFNRDRDAIGVASSALSFSDDEKYLVTSVAGENNVVVYEVDKTTGFLTQKINLPISGEYPKDAALFPDNRHLVSLNHESNTMTLFTTHFDEGLIVMNGPEMPVDRPNCVAFYKLDGK